MAEYFLAQSVQIFNAPFSFLTSVNIRCNSHIYSFSSISCEEERNILRRICAKQRKVNRIGHMLRSKCLLKTVIDGKIGGKKRRIRRRRWRKNRLKRHNDYKDKRRYWKLKEVVLDRTLWRTGFRRGYGPVARRTRTWDHYLEYICIYVHKHTHTRAFRKVSGRLKTSRTFHVTLM
jgi:hypothetical protein